MPIYNNKKYYEISTLAVDGWAFWYSDWARGPQRALQAHPRYAKRKTLPINGQCTNHRILLYNGPLLYDFNVPIKGLMKIHP